MKKLSFLLLLAVCSGARAVEIDRNALEKKYFTGLPNGV